MSIKISRRLSYLTTLIAGFTAAPEDASSVERETSIWITITAEATSRKRSIVRRDLVLQNGYKGAGAQTRFATDLYAALTGQPEALLSVLREGDRDLVLGSLPSYAGVVAEDAPEVAPEAPVVEPVAAPVVEETATRLWVDQQSNEAGLVNRIASVLKKRDIGTDIDEIRSDVGLWLGEWGNKGTFDEIIAEKGSIPFSWLVRAIERKRTSSTYRDAQDALARNRGARTQHEINQRVELGLDDYRAPESLACGDLEVISTKGEDKSGDASWSHEFVSPEASPEDLVQEYCDRDHRVDEGREIVAAAYRGAVERYTAVYDALIEGGSTEDIVQIDGCNESRAITLKSKVRSALREGVTTTGDARATLVLLRMEPFSTKDEIKDHLRSESGKAVDDPRWNRMMAYLRSHALIKEGWGDTFALAD